MKFTIKTVGTLLFCVLFFCLCAFFSLGMLIPGASSAVEGAEMPALVTDGRISDGFGDDFETWFPSALPSAARSLTSLPR